MSSNTNQTHAIEPVSTLQQRFVAATVGGLFGVFLLMGVGFAGGDNFIHNAAHQARQCISLPLGR